MRVFGAVGLILKPKVENLKNCFRGGVGYRSDLSDGERVRVVDLPLSEINDSDFNTIFLGNVFGDPCAVKKNTGGYPADYSEFRSFVGDIVSRLASGGALEVLEIYTPFKFDSLAILLGDAGLKCAEYEDGRLTLEERIPKLYRVKQLVMLDYLEDQRRERACLKHGVPVEEPYWARFKTEA